MRLKDDSDDSDDDFTDFQGAQVEEAEDRLRSLYRKSGMRLTKQQIDNITGNIPLNKIDARVLTQVGDDQIVSKYSRRVRAPKKSFTTDNRIMRLFNGEDVDNENEDGSTSPGMASHKSILKKA